MDRVELAASEMEAISFTTRRKFSPPTFRLQGVEIETKKKMKYLGIWFDSMLSFRHHCLMTAESLMRNLGGPREARRRVMMSTALSIILYGRLHEDTIQKTRDGEDPTKSCAEVC